jgi:NAD(P)-dependent dehydrogenase (short-subunit alcohol dehydrogenase family)
MSFRKLGALAPATSKAGVIAMARHLAMEGRERGIRANSISSGVIETAGDWWRGFGDPDPFIRRNAGPGPGTMKARRAAALSIVTWAGPADRAINGL